MLTHSYLNFFSNFDKIKYKNKKIYAVILLIMMYSKTIDIIMV